MTQDERKGKWGQSLTLDKLFRGKVSRLHSTLPISMLERDIEAVNENFKWDCFLACVEQGFTRYDTYFLDRIGSFNDR